MFPVSGQGSVACASRYALCCTCIAIIRPSNGCWNERHEDIDEATASVGSTISRIDKMYSSLGLGHSIMHVARFDACRKGVPMFYIDDIIHDMCVLCCVISI